MWDLFWGQVSLLALRVSCIRIIPLLQHSFSPFSYHQQCIIFANENLRSSLFWNVTWRRSAVSYRRFETTYRSHPQVTAPKRRWLNTNLRCVTPQKIEDLIYTVVEALKLATDTLSNRASHCSSSPVISSIHGNTFCRPSAWFPKILISLNPFAIFMAQ
jgi:hypothetical protein